MKKKIFAVVVFSLFLAGCDSLRFAPTQAQKKNAWLHLRTSQFAADEAKAENTSRQLQQLTELCSVQSSAFAADYGMPKELPPAQTPEDVLAQSSWQMAQTALHQSAQRPDAWQLADSALELTIGIAALVGGVYGTKAARFLKQARAKSKALREIIAGDELFKKQNEDVASAFKQAHKEQSPATRQIVAQVKTGVS